MSRFRARAIALHARLLELERAFLAGVQLRQTLIESVVAIERASRALELGRRDVGTR